VRYLTLLIQSPDITPSNKDAYVKFLKYNAQTLFVKGISRPDMRVSPDWKSAPPATVDLTTQISGLTMIEAAAKLKAAGLF
jgi:hypothetical protein